MSGVAAMTIQNLRMDLQMTAGKLNEANGKLHKLQREQEAIREFLHSKGKDYDALREAALEYMTGMDEAADLKAVADAAGADETGDDPEPAPEAEEAPE